MKKPPIDELKVDKAEILKRAAIREAEAQWQKDRDYNSFMRRSCNFGKTSQDQ